MTAVAPGAAVITATVEGRTAFCLVTVSAADHAVTAGNDGHGTALASPSNAAQGATVTLLASPNRGYTFKEWTTAGGVTFADRKSASTTFTMPDNAVAVTATFEQDGGSSGGGGTLYAVTAGNDGHGTALASPSNVAQGATVTLLASPKAGYKFKGWTGPDGVTFANAASTNTTFTMPGKAVTVTAAFERDGGGGGGAPTYSV
ncbi:MAG: InlB B-repeat-containing protein, partial [Synergistaceae bacterium]|nr:InlB B-repeat-containing protein [Synergistaceae bacterium]